MALVLKMALAFKPIKPAGYYIYTRINRLGFVVET
jgi:hypothetical protein